MTRTESGRRGGMSSGRGRTAQASERARQRALEALSAVEASDCGHLGDLLTAGHLDGWLMVIERASYRRGYCARDERARREAAIAEQDALVSSARVRWQGAA